ncbi:DUF2811 domain-containing protein [Synechococcus sp. RedBA-s]|uniref:DUF2811 domain-containing protein n=1 Tax=Synechococcus sp. RedBA-s TaxID=2823741 RepID=UPI0028F3E458|nr:DUF2811 domain-containing protein [Synechococcus sp. RedBA-s]
MDLAPVMTASVAAAAQSALAEPDTGVVSFRADVPEALLSSMAQFIDAHPHWDQYRLIQAALAGFLVQNGVQSRAVTRCYVANMFQRAGEQQPDQAAPARPVRSSAPTISW